VAHEAGVATLEEAPAAEPSHEGAPAEAHAAAKDHHGAVGAVFFGPDNHTIDEAHHAPAWVKVSPFLAMLIGLAVAYWFYIVNPEMPKALARNQPVLYRFLLNKWYFDEVYDFLFVRPAKWLGTVLWKGGDGGIIDGTLNGIAMGIVPWFTRLAGRAQSEYLFHYAFAMVLGLVILTLWLGLGGSGQ
jgi:NADH-quinone oxidoreductase subunit L